MARVRKRQKKGDVLYPEKENPVRRVDGDLFKKQVSMMLGTRGKQKENDE